MDLKELDNWELLELYEEIIKYHHYDPCDNIKDRLGNKRSLYGPVRAEIESRMTVTIQS